MQTVLLKTGKIVSREIRLYTGAALIGQPTAYFMTPYGITWVVPGTSVEWIEA